MTNDNTIDTKTLIVLITLQESHLNHTTMGDIQDCVHLIKIGLTQIDRLVNLELIESTGLRENKYVTYQITDRGIAFINHLKTINVRI